MPNLTLVINAEIKKEMDKFPEINWSQVARTAIELKIAQLKFMQEFSKESDITLENAKELGTEVSKFLAKKYIM